MFTSIDTVQAEASYRQDRIAREFRTATRGARKHRGDPKHSQHRRWGLHLPHAA